MKNKKGFAVIAIIFVIILVTYIILTFANSNEICLGHGSTFTDGWPSYSTCEICGITKRNEKPNSDFKVCPECAKATGRCSKCGKFRNIFYLLKYKI